MAKIDQRREHTLGKEKAKALAEEIAADIGQKIGAKYRWEDDNLRFERTGAKGQISVSDSLVRVEVELGFMLRPLKGSIENKIKEYLDEKIT